MMSAFRPLILALPFGLAACHSVSGSPNGSPPAPAAAKPSPAPIQTKPVRRAAPRGQTVNVFHESGARQCEPGNAIPPDEMRRQLGDIRVYAAWSDVLRGVAYPAVCGGPTGSINVYTIDRADLPAAEQRGFSELPPGRSRGGFGLRY